MNGAVRDRTTGAALAVEHVQAFYGESQALFGVSLDVRPGEVVALLGRNGAGKSTTLKSIMGFVPPSAGRVWLRGEDVTGRPPHRMARSGVGYVPEDRRIFPDLSVRENLEIAAKPGPDGRPAPRIDEILEDFVLLKPLLGRKGGFLSGGEQQLLTMARALMGNPDVLLLDEPTEGLAPVMVQAIERVLLALKARRATILLAEQNLGFAGRVADRGFVLDKGRVALSGGMAECANSPEVARLLAV